MVLLLSSQSVNQEEFSLRDFVTTFPFRVLLDKMEAEDYKALLVKR